MKKLPIIIAVLMFLGFASAYAIKHDIHKRALGEYSPVTVFIEKSLGHNPPNFSGSMVGKNAPAFELKSEHGTIKLNDYKGQLILLNFWASWCPPCRAEIPGFIKTQKKYEDKSFSFIGVAIEGKEDALAFSKDFGINYPIAYGLETSLEIASAYGNPDGALPYSILISADQKILSVHAGFLSEDTLDEIIEKNLPE